MSSRIGVYSGEGADPFFTAELQKRLETIVDDRQHQFFQFSSFSELCNDSDPTSIRAIYVPGGNASCIGELNFRLLKKEFEAEIEEKCKKINAFFTESHISLSGHCAGAIFASGGLCERMGRGGSGENFYDDSISPTCRAGLFPGRTVAPLYRRIGDYIDGKLSIENFQVIQISTKINGVQQNVKMPVVLGAGMLNARQHRHTEILSTFVTPPEVRLGQRALSNPSMICEVDREMGKAVFASVFHEGDCRVVLDGCHSEILSTSVRTSLFRNTFAATDAEITQLEESLKGDDALRLQIMKQNSEKIGVVCKP